MIGRITKLTKIPDGRLRLRVETEEGTPHDCLVDKRRLEEKTAYLCSRRGLSAPPCRVGQLISMTITKPGAQVLEAFMLPLL